MPNRNVLMVLTIALGASVALGALDVSTAIVSPLPLENPGLVPVQVMLTNVGDATALVPQLSVSMAPAGYADSSLNISVPPGLAQLVTLTPWTFGGGSQTCTAFITYPADENHTNDTAVVVVNTGGISGSVEMVPCTGMSLTLSPSPLAGNVLHVEYSLSHAGPASVTIFDISGRPIATRRFVADHSGELPMDLRFLSGGVYVVRLADDHQSLVRKFVVQRY